MSGIFGVLHLDGAPAQKVELEAMAKTLERRGPDRTGIWREKSIGLGQTLLATTPEAVVEQLPLKHRPSGCVITADARLDNRASLLELLGLSDRSAFTGDGEIILQTYLKWGKACVSHLLGDFAFAIWDPRKRRMFCARDHMGVRPFYYYNAPGRMMVFASEPQAILEVSGVTRRINEARIADFLISELEGFDKTSTFFQNIYRLPPAMALSLENDHLRLGSYWTLEPSAEIRPKSDAEYEEVFMDVFREAVSCRLRSAGPVGAMLSGGIDSCSVAAVASRLLADQGRGPLRTFSAVGPDSKTCIETRAIITASTIEGIVPKFIASDQLVQLMPELEHANFNLGEPFDCHMTLVRSIYLLAHREGLNVVLDGSGGDVALSHGNYIETLFRRGHPISAFKETIDLYKFWNLEPPSLQQLAKDMLKSVAPQRALDAWRLMLEGHRVAKRMGNGPIDPDFARQIDLGSRLRSLWKSNLTDRSASLSEACTQECLHPYGVSGAERYNRVASSCSVEPRDPFKDIRLLEFCTAMPGEQKLKNGVTKCVMRRAVSGLMPQEVCFRRGKEHLGWSFTEAFLVAASQNDAIHSNVNLSALAPYIGGAASSNLFQSVARHDTRVLPLVMLSSWLKYWCAN